MGIIKQTIKNEHDAKHIIEKGQEKGQCVMDSITRRSFVKGTVVLAGMAIGGRLFVPEALARPTPPSRNSLHIPPTVSPSGLTLTEAPATVDIGGGKLSSVWAYNGHFPGPTILASQGDTASISLVNGLLQETITHWHGMIVDQFNDGHPRLAIAPGATYPYNFTINQRAGLNWYHPHTHLLTNKQVAMGLAGAFIVRDTVENGLGLPSGIYEVPLVVRTTLFF